MGGESALLWGRTDNPGGDSQPAHELLLHQLGRCSFLASPSAAHLAQPVTTWRNLPCPALLLEESPAGHNLRATSPPLPPSHATPLAPCRFARSFFWAGILLAGVMLCHLVLLAVLMWRRDRVPSVMWFPRLEIGASLAVLPLLAWGAAGLFNGNGGDIVLGVVLLCALPLGFLGWAGMLLCRWLLLPKLGERRAVFVLRADPAELAPARLAAAKAQAPALAGKAAAAAGPGAEGENGGGKTLPVLPDGLGSAEDGIKARRLDSASDAGAGAGAAKAQAAALNSASEELVKEGRGAPSSVAGASDVDSALDLLDAAAAEQRSAPARAAAVRPPALWRRLLGGSCGSGGWRPAATPTPGVWTPLHLDSRFLAKYGVLFEGSAGQPLVRKAASYSFSEEKGEVNRGALVPLLERPLLHVRCGWLGAHWVSRAVCVESKGRVDTEGGVWWKGGW